MAEKKEELIGIVGKENVLDSPETLDAYSKDYSFAPPRKPWLLVKPKNTDEVQGIVQWANQTGTPLVPVSSGSPHFYGDTVPTATGAVIVDFGRMKRIVRIDRRNRMALIEPGVTYSELQPELAKEGLRLSTPLLPRANKSVVASLLERQPVLVPKYQWVLLEPLRCLEVVWGNGDRLRTGEAGEHGSLEGQWKMGLAQVNPMGPGQVDYWRLVSAAQGSMGIVTWASIRCEILPQLHKLFFIPAQRLDDLIGCAYRLLRVRLGDEFLLLNNSDLACILGEGADQTMALREELPPWVIIVGVAGRDRLPKERVEFQKKDIAGIAQQAGLQLVPSIPGARDGQVLDAVLNPSREPYWKLSDKGGCQDIFFLTTLDRTPEFIGTVYSVAESLRYPTSDIGIYIQPQQQGVCCHCEFTLPYNPSDQREVAMIREFYTRASEELIKQGAFFSRPYGIWADMAYNRDAQQTILLKKVKGIFDPNNVLNTGKLCF
ncbi:FAD-binding oxidoreductase [Chloroflexota bacterium]